MKYIKSIIFIVGLFIIALTSVLLIYKNNMVNIELKKDTRELIKYIETIDSGEYYYKKGILYDKNNNVMTSEYYINGEGQIIKDDYSNIKLLIKLKDRCVIKTSLGKVVTNTKCINEYNLKPNISRNNSQITFKFKDNVYQYLVSKNNDLKGEWIKLNKDTLIMNTFTEGHYYIWFRDKKGNLSEKVEYDTKCLLSENSIFDNNILYCSGSIVLIDDSKWIVIEDKDKKVSLMKLESLDVKLAHTSGDKEYRWSESIINKYLNETYIKQLNEDIKDKLLEVEICDNYSGTTGCDSEDGCGGYKKQVIEKYKWKCDNYTKSKIRIVSYDEYSTMYDNMKDNTLLYGSYWTINSYKDNKNAISVTYDGKMFVNENITNTLEIKPVITIQR